MKVICKSRVIDLEKYDDVGVCAGIFTTGYSVCAEKGISGVGTRRVEIVCLKEERAADLLVSQIAESWVRGDDYFDVIAWSKNKNPFCGSKESFNYTQAEEKVQ